MPGFAACPTGRCPAASSRSTAAGDSSRELARRSTRDSPPVISACAHLARLSRAGIVFAREGVLGWGLGPQMGGTEAPVRRAGAGRWEPEVWRGGGGGGAGGRSVAGLVWLPVAGRRLRVYVAVWGTGAGLARTLWDVPRRLS